jgi:PAS domain S-box-containing protein
MRKLQQAHADCLVSNQALQGRLGVVEATLERVTTTQAVADIPTRSEAVIVADQEGTITEWNQAATVLFHWRSDEALGMDLRRLIPARYLPLHEARWQEVLRTGRPVRRGPFVLEAQTKDGAKLAVEMILSGWIEPNGPNGGNPTAFFSASIRKLPVDARGRVLERGGYRPLPIPEPSPTATVNVAPPPALPPPDSDAHDPTEPHP